MTARTLSVALSDAAADHGGFWHLDERGEGTFAPHASLFERAQVVAGGLAAHGLRPGATVAVAAAASHEFAASFLGAVLAGCAVTPLPASNLVRGADPAGEHLRSLLVAAQPDLLIADARTRHILAAQPGDPWERCVSAEALPEGPALCVERTLDDRLLVQLTSGSTGPPRRVVLTHRMVDSNVRAIARALAIDGRVDVGVSWLPLHHDMGLVGVLIGTIVYGARSALLPPAAFVKRPALWLRIISEIGGTVSFAPSSAYALAARRLRVRDIEHLDLSRWRVAGCGGEPIDPGALDAFAEAVVTTGFDPRAFAPCYGLAEHVVAATVSPSGRGMRTDVVDKDALATTGIAGAPQANDAPTRRIVSCGRALEGHRVAVVGPDGAALPDRTVGEIELAGPSAMLGYLDAGGQLLDHRADRVRTGDLGYLAGGELYVCGRLKEVIIRRGEKVHPHEIESAAATLPTLRGADVVAFGIVADGEERLVVAVEGRAPDVNLAALIRGVVLERCSVRVDEVVILPPHSIPFTTSGKPRRLAVRDAYEQGVLATVPDRVG